jgi:hypothetical protein
MLATIMLALPPTGWQTIEDDGETAPVIVAVDGGWP